MNYRLQLLSALSHTCRVRLLGGHARRLVAREQPIAQLVGGGTRACEPVASCYQCSVLHST
jgi:hypothetical protein